MSDEGLIFVPPPSSGWNWYNQSSGTATTIDNNAINLYVPKHGTANNESISGYYRTAPSTPYTIIANIVYNSLDTVTTGTFYPHGIGFTDGTKLVWLNTRVFTTGYGICVSYWSDANTGVANDFNGRTNTATAYPWPNNQWFMIRDNGTNIYYYMSNDTQENGQSWVQLYNQARTTRLTPSSVGFFFGGRGNTDISVTLNSWISLGV